MNCELWATVGQIFTLLFLSALFCLSVHGIMLLLNRIKELERDVGWLKEYRKDDIALICKIAKKNESGEES